MSTLFLRSSAAEYLTFVAVSATGGVEVVSAHESAWLSDDRRAQLFEIFE